MDAPTRNAPTQAEIYDREFVPALFAHWGPRVAEAAGAGPGMKVLDVGCGTGALALALADAVGSEGEVVGLDPNPEMLAVARTKPIAATWADGVAESLPFPDASFDAVASQFACMFFTDPPKALAEMHRVARPGGRVAVAVCGDVETSPGYAAFAGLLDRLFGTEVGDSFRAPFALGEAGKLARLCEAAGIAGASVTELHGLVRFASIDELVSTERACAWTLGGILDDDQFDRLVAESQGVLQPFVDAAGRVAFDMPALVLTFRKA